MSNNPGQPIQQGGDPEANKRAALAGQWRTPPMPTFPGGYYPPHQQQQQQQQQQQADELPNPTSIPDNSEDYAKALQEAYRKGAEAAARMAQHQQQQQQIPTAASCPNFGQNSNAGPPPASGVGAEEAAYHATSQSHQSTGQLVPSSSTSAINTNMATAVPDPLVASSMNSTMSTIMPPPPPPSSMAMMHHHHHGPPTHSSQHAHDQHAQAPPPPQQTQTLQSQSHPQQQNQHTSQPQPPPQGRSLSLPDMSAYATQAEEEKRQKRLARNRASARLRRLRKKNLVDAYETEVGILEKTLKQLKAHEWGQDDNHKALLEALGMERGQQAIQPEQRTGIIKDILKQQMLQVELLKQSQLEQECLAMIASGEEEDDDMTRELQEILNLNQEQKTELMASSKGLDKEVEALETVSQSLQAMQENDWLLNEGVQTITDQFTSILHKNQLSKFLLWTDANVESIDQLDHVQVQPLQTAPIFTFGVETTPGDDDDK